jgi:hypothetical protein
MDGPTQGDQNLAGTTIHYHFPIEVVVVGEIGEEVAWQIEERIWQSLDDALG